MLQQQKQKMDQLNIFLSEERNKNQQYIKQIKTLEDTIKTVNSEYQSISQKFGKMENEEETLEQHYTGINLLILDLKRNYNDSKVKIEELIKVNNELKHKIIENENTIKLHSDDFKLIIKKQAQLQKKNEELEKEKSRMYSDLCYKDERLKALRFMNSKLEQKSKDILQKWEMISDFQIKANEVSEANTQMINIIEKLKDRLENLGNENKELKETLDKM